MLAKWRRGGQRGAVTRHSAGCTTEMERCRVSLLSRLKLLFDRIFTHPAHAAERETRDHLNALPDPPPLDYNVVVVFITAALSLTLLEYYGMSNRYPETVKLLDAVGLNQWACRLDAALDTWGSARHCRMSDTWPVPGVGEALPTVEINRLTYWSVGCFTVYFVIPVIAIKVFLRQRIRDFGLSFKGIFKDWWIYALMFGVVLPLVFVVARDPHFQDTYPFYSLAEGEPLWPNFWRWEFMYFTQFFALEFFFRGFMVHGTRARLGYYSIFAMMLPYCMIHFGKPMPETIGAIIAGIALGSLSLKSRSIWLGVAIHASVALSMDFASLWQKGYF